MIAEMAQWLVDMIFEMGYTGIFLLMAVESSVIPFPSEIVLIPAGYLAHQGEMNLGLILFASLGGSLAGALVNYFGALLVGRALLLRYGRYFFVKPQALDKMDLFFERHGHISTFTGRLIPGIRQLISIPAGLARMDLKRFVFFTGLGAGIWSAVLIMLGYMVGENEELIKTYLKQITLLALGFVMMTGLAYYYIRKKRDKKL